MQPDGAGATYAGDLNRAEPAIAERRGVWTSVVLAGTDGFSAMCITDDSTHLFAKDMVGSLGTPTDHAAPGPRALTATDLGAGTMRAGDLSLAAATAGSDIVGVVYHSRTHGDVSATVSPPGTLRALATRRRAESCVEQWSRGRNHISGQQNRHQPADPLIQPIAVEHGHRAVRPGHRLPQGTDQSGQPSFCGDGNGAAKDCVALLAVGAPDVRALRNAGSRASIRVHASELLPQFFAIGRGDKVPVEGVLREVAEHV